MLFYTWKDIERKLLFHKKDWGTIIAGIEVYVSEAIIYLVEKENEKLAQEILEKIFGGKYDSTKNRISLDVSNKFLDITFETEEDSPKNDTVAPLFKNILYQDSALEKYAAAF